MTMTLALFGVPALALAVAGATSTQRAVDQQQPPATAMTDCQMRAQGVLPVATELAARLEATRQTNGGPGMRAALDDMQNALGRLREALESCARSDPGAPTTEHSQERPDRAVGTSGLAVDHTGHNMAASAKSSDFTIRVTDSGFEPASISLTRGQAVRLTFLRTSEKTCATEVVFPDFGIRKALPLNEAVTVEITPARAGEFTFVCGMNMFKGKVVVE